MQSKSVDLIYLDPPFNSGKKWENPIEAGGKKAKVSFKDTWNLDDIHTDEEYELLHYAPNAIPLINSLYQINGGSWRAYLIYMGIRLAEMHRVLKDTGTIYYHCDATMSHGVKLLMDCIFRKANFRNHLAWCYKENEAATKHFPRKHDHILFYSKGKDYVFNIVRGEITEAQAKRYNHIDEEGNRWANMKGKMRKLEGGAKIRDWWELPITQQSERTGYPTQKPLALLKRIIKASSNKGDIVLDPFCGCATTCVAANYLERQWIGIDLSENAEHFIRSRITKESSPLIDKEFIVNPKQEPRADLPPINKDDVKADKFAKSNICPGCKKEKELEDMDLDHIVPKVRGGQDQWRNYQLLCRNCNTSKGGKGMAEWRKYVMQKEIEAYSKKQEDEKKKWLDDQQAKREELK